MTGVSVVVPVYNTGEYLRQCLDSIVSQTFLDMEIICVNDGSTDESATILEQFALQDNRVRILTQENKGLSSARNSGLDVASGDYVLFLDSDDFFELTMVEELHSRCLEHDADMGICRIRYVYDDKGVSLEADWSVRTDLLPESLPFSRADVVGNVLLAVTPSVWNKMFRRRFLIAEKLRFLPELRRAEDVPFTYMALLKAQRITIVNAALVNYRQGSTNSLQATVHERPTEICRALASLKHRAVDEGIFENIERDYVNAAIDQCLYTLEIVTTLAAFRELYEALNSTYLTELGIDGRPEDYFSKSWYFEQCIMLRSLSPEAYLFNRAQSLRKQRDDAAMRLHEMRAALDGTRAMLDETECARQRLSAEMVGSTAELESMRDQMEGIRAVLFDRRRTLGFELSEVRAQLKRKTVASKKASAKLRSMRASRSYKFGRAVTAIPRRARLLYYSFRKVK